MIDNNNGLMQAYKCDEKYVLKQAVEPALVPCRCEHLLIVTSPSP